MSKFDPKERQLRDEMFSRGLLWCVDCKQFKPMIDFGNYSFARSNYGHKSYCKDCWKLRGDKYNHDELNRQSQRNKKFKLLQLAGGKCCRCGYREFPSGLDFHHIDPTQKRRDQFVTNQGYEKALIEVDRCAVLCRNCHAAYHASEWTATFIKRDGIGWAIAEITRIYADTSDEDSHRLV